ncbi:MAG: RNA polymerase factor sigma-54 [Gammaproteobacteria bacterium]|nr:RNA polymerase factor sigma-54 [Gammaproteobacteria bacterium]
MKQSLQLRISQQLTMTPQLQMAIKMLQLSTLELQLEVQQALDSNLMLEEGDEGSVYEEQQEADNAPHQQSDALSVNGNDDDLAANHETPVIERRAADEISSNGNDQIPDELPIDSNWDDIYDLGSSSNSSAGSSQEGDDDQNPFERHNQRLENLGDYMHHQLQHVNLNDNERIIAEALVDALNRDGFITTPLEELQATLAAQQLVVEEDEILVVLHLLQSLDPPGIAARNLQESLLLQLRQLVPVPDERKMAERIIERYFDLLASRDYNQLKRRLKTDDATLGAVIDLIRSLNPRPAGQLGVDETQYITPDVIVSRTASSWRVELNSDAIPKLRINNHYASLIKEVRGDDASTLKSHLQEAKWFLKSIQSRNETLLKVALCIVEHQRAFLEQGEVAMRPMVLLDIANELEMHESTISRTTTRKYMHTPQGIFELKYFFSSHVGTAGGGECSSTAIRAMIKTLISDEQAKKPLSDNKIAGILCGQGINIARRTVAKYREAMGIPPSNERKQLA